MGRGDQQGNIMLTTAIADHPDGHGNERTEQPAQYIGGMSDLVAYNRNDGMVFFDFDGTEGFEFTNDGLQFGNTFDREGYRHFRSGDHIDRGAVFFEDLEDLPQ